MSTPHWQLVENVAAHFERIINKAMPGVKVTQKAKIPVLEHPEHPVEIDILVSFMAGHREVRIGIDVKNEAEPLDRPAVGLLYQNASIVGLTKYIIVSTSGFAQPAKDIYGPKGVDFLTMEQVETLEWSGVGVMQFTHNITHLDEVQFRYADDDEEGLARAIEAHGTLTTGELTLTDTDGPSRRFQEWLEVKIGNTIKGKLPPDFPSGQEVPFEFEMDMTEAESRRRYRLVGLAEFDPPATIVCMGKFWIERAEFPFVNFKYDGGLEGMTALVEHRFGSYQQSLIRKVMPDGTETLHLVRGPAKPKQTKV